MNLESQAAFQAKAEVKRFYIELGPWGVEEAGREIGGGGARPSPLASLRACRLENKNGLINSDWSFGCI